MGIALAFLVAACTGLPSVDPAQSPEALGAPTATAPPPAQTAAAEPPTAEPAPKPTLLPYTTPAWFQDAVVYEVFVRSFADSDGDGIGDLQGVRTNLNYIQSLGADVIWLMPIYPSPSQHGYDVVDFMAVNPDYGTLADLQALVADAHERGLRIVLDYVPSHLSNQNASFEAAYGTPESAFADWFVFTNDAHTQYAGFAGSREMPRFNHYNPEVVAFLGEAALFWLDLDGDGDYTDGVDGFRVDNVTFPPREFLIELRQRIKQANPLALLLGEAWKTNPGDLAPHFLDQFDALFNFPFYALMEGDHNSNQDGLLAGRGFTPLLSNLLAEESQRYPEQAVTVRYLSNHDTNRIATEVGGDPDRQRLAATLTAVLPGPALIYYGEEIGMPGQKGGAPYYDNYRREPMDWFRAELGPQQTTWFKPEDRWNAPLDGISVEEQDADPDSLLNHYRQVFRLRREYPVLGTGSTRVLELQSQTRGPWGVEIYDQDQRLVALFNFGVEPAEITIGDFPLEAPELVDLLSGDAYPGSSQDQPFQVSLPPAAAIVLSE